MFSTGCALEPIVCAPCEGACPSGLTCAGGRCQVAGFLCPKSRPLGAADAEVGATPDTPVDAASDAALDAAPDAAPDAALPTCPTPSVRWTRLWDYPQTAGPFPRAGAAGVFVGEAFYVFGGTFSRDHPEVPPNTLNGEVWRYADGAWTQGPSCPEPRIFHRVVPTNDGFVVLSSAQEGRAHWRFSADPPRWESIATRGDPLPLDWNDFAVGGDADGVFAYGGASRALGVSPPPFHYIRPLAGTHLPIRTGSLETDSEPIIRHGGAFDPARRHFYIINGAHPPGGWQAIRRAWVYDATDNAFRKLPEPNAPPALDTQVVAWLPTVDLLFVFGGQDPLSYATDGVWLYQPTLRQWTALPGGGPTARSGAAAAVAPDGRRVFVYGGVGSRSVAYEGQSDLWQAEILCD